MEKLRTSGSPSPSAHWVTSRRFWHLARPPPILECNIWVGQKSSLRTIAFLLGVSALDCWGGGSVELFIVPSIEIIQTRDPITLLTYFFLTQSRWPLKETRPERSVGMNIVEVSNFWKLPPILERNIWVGQKSSLRTMFLYCGI